MWNKTLIKYLAFLVLALIPAQAVLIPTDQLTDWTVGTRVGVTGGIPTNRTQFTDVSQPPYSVDTTGAAAASVTTPKIQAALNACPANQYVFLPAGTYRVTQLAMPSNVTIRGAGPDVTILRHAGGGTTILATSQNQNYSWLNGVTVTAGNTRDSTVLTLADTSAFVVGHIAQLQWSNMTDNTTLANGTNYIVSGTDGPGFGAHVRRQTVRITAKTATTLTIFPGIVHTVQTGTTLTIAAPVPIPAGANKSGVGVEDLTIDGIDLAPTFGVWLENVRDSWCKNVKAIRIANYPFYSSDAINVEFTHCFASGGTGGTNGAGFLINSVTGAYIYNNIIDRVQPSFEVNFGTVNSVFAYNLGEGLNSTQNINHGPHNSHNLYEGNVVPSVQCDGYFGGASQQILFRNWIHGTDLTGSFQTFMIGFNRWTRYHSVVGNLLGNPGTTSPSPYSLGNPNIGNSSFTGFYQMSVNNFPVEWKNPATLTSGGGTTSGTMTLPSGNLHTGQFRPAIAWNNGANWARMANVVVSGTTVNFTVETGDTLPANGTALVLWSGQEGFQGQDRDVFATYDGGSINLRVNYYMKTSVSAIPGNEVLGADTFPNSLYLSAKPLWFGNLTWPPFDPQAPGSLTTSERYQRIPAGYRFINGVDPPAGTDTTPPNLVSKTIGPTGTQLTLVFSETVSIGLGGNGGWTLNMSGVGTETLTYASGSGSSTLVFNISRPISAGETGTVSYTQPGNGVEDTSGNDLLSLSNSTVNNQASGDTTAPTPNPSTFSIIPQATGPSTITMTATTATDATGPVQYYFNETTGNAGGNDSGWQSSPTYVDTGLAAGTQYSYRVQVRDAVTPTPNVTTFSSSLSAITRLAAGARPATPFRMARANIVTP